MDMKIAGARWADVALNTAILLSAFLVAHLIFIGGIDLRFGGVVQGLGKVKFTCNKLANPLILLAVLLLLKPVVARPAPLRRLTAWLKASRRTILLGTLVTIAAALPRFHRLDAQSLNPDALLWLERSQRTVYALRAGDYAKATDHLGHPGVVPAVLIGASYIYLGEGTSTLSWGLLDPLTAARLPIALMGTLTCLLLYLFGRRSFGDASAFWGAIFLALYPPHVALSRVVHIDSTLALFFMCAILCYLIATETSRAGWMAASAISFGFALLTKSPALLIPFVLLFWKACAAVRDGGGPLRVLETRDLAWLGAGLGIYFIIFTRLWLPPGRMRWAAFSSFLPHADQTIAAVRAVGSFPWAAVFGALLAAGVLYTALRRRALPCSGGRAPARLALALFLLLSCLAFIRAFNVPIQNQILLMGKTFHVEEIGHVKYWMGRLVTHPPRWFYLFMLAVQTPPAVLALAAWGAAAACAAFAARSGRWRALLLLLATLVVFIGVMSIGKKMGMRYIAPVFPFLCLLAGVGLTRLAAAVSRPFPLPRREDARRTALALAGSILAAACVVPIVRIFPYPDNYFNGLAGGTAGASRIISIGAGVGTREAVAYLKTRAKSGDSIYVPTIHGEFRWHWLNDEPRTAPRVLVNRTKPPHVDWVVFPLADRFKPQCDGLRLLEGECPRVWEYVLCGVDFVDIYKVEDPPENAGRLYEAEELKTDSGAKTPDNDASEGAAVRGTTRGAVLYGPWERYAPGAWRAVFRVKGAGDTAARLSVAGISKGEAFGSRELRPGDLAPGGAYRDVPVDFTLEAPRRIQFCADLPASGDLWIDRVAVERR